jgi:hypothetical protein
VLFLLAVCVRLCGGVHVYGDVCGQVALDPSLSDRRRGVSAFSSSWRNPFGRAIGSLYRLLDFRARSRKQGPVDPGDTFGRYGIFGPLNAEARIDVYNNLLMHLYESTQARQATESGAATTDASGAAASKTQQDSLRMLKSPTTPIPLRQASHWIMSLIELLPSKTRTAVARAPTNFVGELFPHQQRYLHWSTAQERTKTYYPDWQCWPLDDGSVIWIRRDARQCADWPPEDDGRTLVMDISGCGVGKTVQNVALVLANPCTSSSSAAFCKTTLIFCPGACVNQWCTQFTVHSARGSTSIAQMVSDNVFRILMCSACQLLDNGAQTCDGVYPRCSRCTLLVEVTGSDKPTHTGSNTAHSFQHRALLPTPRTPSNTAHAFQHCTPSSTALRMITTDQHLTSKQITHVTSPPFVSFLVSVGLIGSLWFYVRLSAQTARKCRTKKGAWRIAGRRDGRETTISCRRPDPSRLRLGRRHLQPQP